MPAVGEQIGPYLLGRSLGSGAFGEVFEATHADTGVRAAIKVLHGQKEIEPEVQNRFVREIALLERLNDPHIVRHYDCGLHGDSLYCAMELVECGSLKEVLERRGSLPWRDAAEVAKQTALGLDHAHKLGCVHRDLKPANLYLSSDGHVKIGDLGLARDLNNSRLTVQGQTVGTWRYMPPEQITGADDIDGRLDLYALGCILHEMLTGRVPFDGPNFAAIFDQHLEVVPPRVDTIAAGIPPALADLVAALLEKEPANRPATGADVAARIDDIVANPEQAAAAAAEVAESDEPPPNLTERLRAPGGRTGGPNPVALGVLGGAAVVGAVAWAIWRFSQ